MSVNILSRIKQCRVDQSDKLKNDLCILTYSRIYFDQISNHQDGLLAHNELVRQIAYVRFVNGLVKYERNVGKLHILNIGVENFFP